MGDYRRYFSGGQDRDERSRNTYHGGRRDQYNNNRGRGGGHYSGSASGSGSHFQDQSRSDNYGNRFLGFSPREDSEYSSDSRKSEEWRPRRPPEDDSFRMRAQSDDDFRKINVETSNLEALKYLERLRSSKPFLQKRRREIVFSNKQKLLEDEMDDIDFCLDVISDTNADKNFGYHAIKTAHDKVLELVRNNPITWAPPPLIELDGDDEAQDVSAMGPESPDASVPIGGNDPSLIPLERSHVKTDWNYKPDLSEYNHEDTHSNYSRGSMSSNSSLSRFDQDPPSERSGYRNNYYSNQANVTNNATSDIGAESVAKHVPRSDWSGNWGYSGGSSGPSSWNQTETLSRDQDMRMLESPVMPSLPETSVNNVGSPAPSLLPNPPALGNNIANGMDANAFVANIMNSSILNQVFMGLQLTPQQQQVLALNLNLTQNPTGLFPPLPYFANLPPPMAQNSSQVNLVTSIPNQDNYSPSPRRPLLPTPNAHPSPSRFEPNCAPRSTPTFIQRAPQVQPFTHNFTTNQSDYGRFQTSNRMDQAGSNSPASQSSQSHFRISPSPDLANPSSTKRLGSGEINGDPRIRARKEKERLAQTARDTSEKQEHDHDGGKKDMNAPRKTVQKLNNRDPSPIKTGDKADFPKSIPQAKNAPGINKNSEGAKTREDHKVEQGKVEENKLSGRDEGKSLREKLGDHDEKSGSSSSKETDRPAMGLKGYKIPKIKRPDPPPEPILVQIESDIEDFDEIAAHEEVSSSPSSPDDPTVETVLQETAETPQSPPDAVSSTVSKHGLKGYKIPNIQRPEPAREPILVEIESDIEDFDEIAAHEEVSSSPSSPDDPSVETVLPETAETPQGPPDAVSSTVSKHGLNADDLLKDYLMQSLPADKLSKIKPDGMAKLMSSLKGELSAKLQELSKEDAEAGSEAGGTSQADDDIQVISDTDDAPGPSSKQDIPERKSRQVIRKKTDQKRTRRSSLDKLQDALRSINFEAIMPLRPRRTAREVEPVAPESNKRPTRKTRQKNNSFIELGAEAVEAALKQVQIPAQMPDSAEVENEDSVEETPARVTRGRKRNSELPANPPPAKSKISKQDGITKPTTTNSHDQKPRRGRKPGPGRGRRKKVGRKRKVVASKTSEDKDGENDSNDAGSEAEVEPMQQQRMDTVDECIRYVCQTEIEPPYEEEENAQNVQCPMDESIFDVDLSALEEDISKTYNNEMSRPEISLPGPMLSDTVKQFCDFLLNPPSSAEEMDMDNVEETPHDDVETEPVDFICENVKLSSEGQLDKENINDEGHSNEKSETEEVQDKSDIEVIILEIQDQLEKQLDSVNNSEVQIGETRDDSRGDTKSEDNGRELLATKVAGLAGELEAIDIDDVDEGHKLGSTTRESLKDEISKTRSEVEVIPDGIEQDTAAKDDIPVIVAKENIVFVSVSEQRVQNLEGIRGVPSHSLYQCANERCNFTAADSISFKDHSNNCGSVVENKQLICFHCDKKLKTTATLLEHLKTHGRQRQICTLCPFRCWLNIELAKHMKISHKVSNYKIVKIMENGEADYLMYPKDVWSKLAQPKSINENTILYCPRVQFTPEEISSIPRNAIFPSFVHCGICKYSTKVRSNLIRHLNLHEQAKVDGGITEVPTEAPVNPVPHLERNELFFDKMTNWAGSSHTNKEKNGITAADALKVPQFVMEQFRYVCSVPSCKQLTGDDSLLRSHMKALHSDVDIFACPHCQGNEYTRNDPRNSVSIDKIGTHLKLHGSRLLKCNHCDYIHTQTRIIEKHVADKHPEKKRIHLVVRNVDGEGNSSNRRPSLEDLQKSSSERWRCTLCRALSDTWEEAKSHCEAMHGIDSQFLCSSCRFGTTSIFSLESHLVDSVCTANEKPASVMIMFSRNDMNSCAESKEEPSTPIAIWRRDESKIKHIRGIYLEDCKERKEKEPKEVKVKPKTAKMKEIANMGTVKVATDSESNSEQTPIKPSKGPGTPTRKIKATTTASSPTTKKMKIASASTSGEEQFKMAKATQIIKTAKSMKRGKKKVSVHQLDQTKPIYQPTATPPLLVCPTCKMYKTTKLNDFVIHLYNEMQYKRYGCNLCEIGFVTLESLKIHIINDHEAEYDEATHLRLAPSDPALEDHVEEILRNEMQDKTEQVQPVAKYPGVLDVPVNCKHCDAPFTSYHNYKTHLLAKHVAPNRFTCMHCPLGSWSDGPLRLHHLKMHSGKEFGFVLNRELEESLTPEFWFFKYGIPHTKWTKGGLGRPTKESSGTKTITPGPVESAPLRSRNTRKRNLFTYKCAHCPNFLASLRTVRNHWTKIHKIQKNACIYFRYQNIVAPDKLQCGLCPFAVSSHTQLGAHFRYNHSGVKVSFKLDQPMVSESLNKVKLVCSYCGHKAVGIAKMEFHSRGSHLNSNIGYTVEAITKAMEGKCFIDEVTYACIHCKQRFDDEDSCLSHMMTIHDVPMSTVTAIEIRVQKECNLGTQKAMEELEAGEGALQCPKCEYNPKSLSDAKEHLKTNHIYPFKCPTCFLLFKSPAEATVHAHHNHGNITLRTSSNKNAVVEFAAMYRQVTDTGGSQQQQETLQKQQQNQPEEIDLTCLSNTDPEDEGDEVVVLEESKEPHPSKKHQTARKSTGGIPISLAKNNNREPRSFTLPVLQYNPPSNRQEQIPAGIPVIDLTEHLTGQMDLDDYEHYEELTPEAFGSLPDPLEWGDIFVDPGTSQGLDFVQLG